MSLYLQIILLLVAFIVFIVLAMFVTGWGLRRVCFQIIAHMEKAGAYSAARAIRLADERRNFFRVGTGNLRPRALGVLISDGLVVQTPGGKYYLDKNKLAAMNAKLVRKN